MSAGQVLNAATYYTTLAPNDALPDTYFCNQCKPLKAQILELASKNFHKTCGSRKKTFCTKHILFVMSQRHKTS